ncbi:MAG: GtrA family protein [Ruminococcaceae bacterium]|nr:GtrA family protein [Oscillospiraceae bacterium]
MIKSLLSIYQKNKHIITYLVFGVLTTAVDFVSYIILANTFSINENIANILSQVIAIIFAFVTNKLFVFEDKNLKLKHLLTQFTKFASLRLVTLVLNSAMFFVMVDLCSINDLISKIVIAVIVIILNYIFSKLIVFKKAKQKEE